MRLVKAIFFLGALGCSTSLSDRPVMSLPSCIELLAREARHPEARLEFPRLLHEADDDTMTSMRTYHGTGEAIMRHNYPSHAWIHPFLRACRLVKNGDLLRAGVEFSIARSEAMKHPESLMAAVVAEEARLRIEEIRGH